MTVRTRDPADSARGSRPSAAARLATLRRHPTTVTLARCAWILACTMLAFRATASLSVQAGAGGDLSGYTSLMAPVGIVAAIGIARRRGPELPIHDRQIDSIVGGIVLILAVSVQWLLTPRYAEQFLLLRIDLLASILFLLGASILMFGLRPAGRFWPVWLLMLGVAPLTYRLLSVALGGDWQGRSLAMALVTAAGIAIAVGRNRRRAVVGAAATFLISALAIAALGALAPEWPLQVLLLAPPIVGAAVVTGAMYLRTGYVFAKQGQPHRLIAGRPLATTKGMWRASGTVLAVAIGLSLISLPNEPIVTADNIAVGPATAGPTAVPAGWTQVGEWDYPWITRFFGDDATLTRQKITAWEPNPEWDSLSRPRTIMVDTLTTDLPALLSVYPADTLYPTSRTRVSPRIPVDLGHGVVGDLYTIVDEEALLTWTKLSFEWSRGGSFQRVSLITVDNHLPLAEFPEPTPSMASDIANTLNVLLRGNAVTENDQPVYKDLPMLTSVGRELVDAQMEDA